MNLDEYKDINVKHFKLSSGDEILGLVAGIDTRKGVIHLEYPVLIELLGKSYMMADYMPTSTSGIIAFTTHHIIAQSDVHESVKEEYIKYCLGYTDEPEHDDLEFMNTPVDKSKFH